MNYDCEHCKKDWASWCINGVLWLCWSCYCAEMKASRRNSGE